ncbi:hypothetical protein INR49_024198, partial [Caranx melampygus]
MERKKQVQVGGTTVRVVKKSVRIMETKEEGEVDELEEQIKQVFLKGLLPEEEEAEVRQQSEIEVTDESVLNDGLKKRLQQIEEEWQSEVEDKLGSPEEVGSTYAVEVQRVERRTKKKVTIVDETGQMLGDADNMQEQADEIQERLEKQDMWRKTDVLVERTLREATLELQANDQPQVEDTDVWYILFDRPPYKAVFIPPVTTVEYAQVDKGEDFTVKTEIEKTEIIIEQSEIKEEDTWRAPEIPPPQVITEIDDDWFVLLDGVPREISYVPPVALKEQEQVEAERFLSVIEAPEVQEIREIVVEERKITEDTPRSPQEIPPQPPVRDRDDDWFVLLDAVPKEMSYVPPVAVVERAQVSPGEFVSVIQVATMERSEKRVAVTVEDAEVKKELSEKRVAAVPQAVKEIEDDWFVLLDLAIRETSYVPPVSPAVPSQIYPSAQPQIKVTSTEQKLQQFDFDQIRPQPSRPLPERDDDWFVLFDAVRDKAVILPSVTPFEIVRGTRKTSEVEVKTTETRTWEKTIIGVDRRQDETRFSDMRQIQIAPPSEREGGDEWFVLFDIIREKPVVVPSVVSTQRGARPVSAPVFSQAALAEAGIPMAPFDQPQTSTPIKTTRMEERKLEVTVEAVEPSKESVSEVKPAVWRDQGEIYSSLISTINGEIQHGSEVTSTEVVRMRKEFDKPQEDLLRHHASISKLKKNFMEAVPEPRPSEWDKRLSTHSPFRTLGINGQPLPSADGSEPDSVEGNDGPIEEESCDQDEVVVFETSLVPIVEVEMAQLPPSLEPQCKTLDELQEEEGSYPGASECSGRIVGSSPASYFRSSGPQPPLVQTQTVTITAVSNSLPTGISTTEVPIVPTKTFTYESSKVTVDGTDEDKDGTTMSSSKTVTSETTSGTTVTTTTTHISKVVKSGSSETRVEKRIVITADSDIDQDKLSCS